jgi:hypothetical protein
MEQIQSSSYKKMSKRSGKYVRSDDVDSKTLNVSSAPISVKSTNKMKKKSSKSFPVAVRASNRPTNMSSKAVSKKTSGMKGAGKTFMKGTKGVDTSRVDQVSPAQMSPKQSPTSKTMSANAAKQNKSPRSNMGKGLSMFKGY